MPLNIWPEPSAPSRKVTWVMMTFLRCSAVERPSSPSSAIQRIRQEGLRTVGQRGAGVGVRFDHHAVRAGRQRRPNQRRHQVAAPRRVDSGRPTIGRRCTWLSSATADRSIRNRVVGSKLRMPRSHNTTPAAPCTRQYSAANSHSLTVARHAPFQKDRAPGGGDALQQRIVLHVARADLDEVSVLSDRVALFLAHALGHEPHALLARRFAQPGQRLFSVALKAIRRGPWLERAPSQKAHAVLGEAGRHATDVIHPTRRCRAQP